MIEVVLRAWAANAAAFADVLADQDPAWGSVAYELAGGWAVLCGPGMFVNRALGVGIGRPMTGAEFDEFAARCAEVGVEPAIEITPATHPDTVAIAAARGFVEGVSTSALRRGLDDASSLPVDPTLVIEPAGDQLAVWQETSAIGWGYTSPGARRAGDAYGRAAAVVDGDGFVLARSVDDGRPVACASLTIRDDVATIGGMATLPSERGRGIQAALIHHRLRVSAAARCSIATSTAARGGVSERNLIRHGFEPWFTITTMTTTMTAAGQPRDRARRT